MSNSVGFGIQVVLILIAAELSVIIGLLFSRLK